MFQNTSLHTALDAVTSELELPHPQYGSTKQQNTKIISANIHLKPQYTNHFYVIYDFLYLSCMNGNANTVFDFRVSNEQSVEFNMICELFYCA